MFTIYGAGILRKSDAFGISRRKEQSTIYGPMQRFRLRQQRVHIADEAMTCFTEHRRGYAHLVCPTWVNVN
jgi:hypothetical protein